MHKQVLIIQRRLTKYREPLFQKLRDQLSKNGITLNLVYGKPSESEALKNDEGYLPWATEVSSRYFHIGAIQPVWQTIPNALLKEQDLVIIPHENSMLFNYVLLTNRFLKGLRLAYFGHGANFQSSNHTFLKEKIKSSVIPLVDWWFAYSELSVQKVLASGFPRERITCLNNAIDSTRLKEFKISITAEEREELKKDLGIHAEHAGVFLGSLHREKRLNFLFASSDLLRREIPDFELIIIGDGPLRHEAMKFAETRPWAKWVGTRHLREKALYASLGRVMLNPGLVGLGIVDSFALGIPLVTTDCGIHSPEIAYLESGRNGLMTEDSLSAFTSGAKQLLTDDAYLKGMVSVCEEDSMHYTLDKMVDNFSRGIMSALGLAEEAPVARIEPRRFSHDLSGTHVAIIWQRFLPYHRARINRLEKRLSGMGCRLTAIEVASRDAVYNFPQEQAGGKPQWFCCFPGTSYHDLRAGTIHARILKKLNDLRPDIVFAPATAFPEGMAAISYRIQSGMRTVVMDDAWEVSDQRGALTREAKRIIHRNVDAAFVPAPSHLSYYVSLDIPQERIVYGVDVVDNDYFAQKADEFRADEKRNRGKIGIPDRYFLFTGRFLPRKGIETLIEAFKTYRVKTGKKPWDLVLVGGGPHQESLEKLTEGTPGIHLAGMKFGDELCRYYALAGVVVVPSIRDPWVLVVNEAMASGLPVMVSRGCGSARELVHEGENGWTFPPLDVGALSGLLLLASDLPTDTLRKMGKRSREIISHWSLDRFGDGVVAAMEIPRRSPAGIVSKTAARLWKGRVSLN